MVEILLIQHKTVSNQSINHDSRTDGRVKNIMSSATRDVRDVVVLAVIRTTHVRVNMGSYKQYIIYNKSIMPALILQTVQPQVSHNHKVYLP